MVDPEFYDCEKVDELLAKIASELSPPDYDQVRTNAATGAEHAGETGNPHSTTPEQVGYRVVELVVEGAAKNIYLMNNGERTTERVTSYASLLALTKRGLVRLYYNAVGGTGRKTLYTPHMVDDAAGEPPTMRFDATGTLGQKVYTRSIALTKSGTDSIAVTIGDLTELQKSLTLAQLTNIADVTNKRDKTDNICAADSNGDWRLVEGTAVDKIKRFFLIYVTDDNRWELYVAEAASDYDGPSYYFSDTGGSPDDKRVTLSDGDYTLVAEKPIIAKSGESYTTPTGVLSVIKTDTETRSAITALAEQASQVNASTALALKDRDCCLVPFTANMTFTFAAKEEGKTGLRSFEVIVTGCVKDGAVNWPAVTYRGDSADLIPEDGDNHWTFAEHQDGSFAVTRHIANTFTIGE